MRFLRLLLAAALVVLSAGPLAAADLIAPERPIERVIDHYVDALLKEEHVVAAPIADDATLVRRLTLDLAGRIPTPAETSAYVESKDARKKNLLVERLIASPSFVRHQAAMFDAMMMNAAPGNGKGDLRDYFNTALAGKRSWNQIFRDLVTPDETDPNQKGAGEFLKSRVKDLDRLTIDVSSLFFGVNVSCAQCHNHPHVRDWKQDNFFGMKSFFSRTVDNGGSVAEREFGLLKFVPNKGSEKLATPLFLTGKAIDLPNFREPTSAEQKQDKERLDKTKASKAPSIPPAVSARKVLVDAALQEGNSEFFDKAIVNRLWHRFFGYGLVNPLDQMHSENPPSHPELLDWLARDMAAHGYDLRRLIAGIVSSEPYARSSKYPSEAPPESRFFAVARLKPLTPMQFAVSLKVATTDPAAFENLKEDALEKKFEQIEGSVRGFASSIAVPGDDFQIGVGEALLFSNGNRVMQDYLGAAPGTLLGRIGEPTDRKQAIDLIVSSILCRPPTAEESKLFEDFLRKRSDRPKEACRQLVWALMASSEFRFNY